MSKPSQQTNHQNIPCSLGRTVQRSFLLSGRMKILKQMGSIPVVLLSNVTDRMESFCRQITSRSHIVSIIFAGVALSLVLFYAARAPPAQAWLRGFAFGKSKLDHEKNRNMTENVRAKWEIHSAEEDENWAGLQKMRKERVDRSALGSMWWDERAEQYFISKLEESQFPANCTNAHWIAHYDWVSGLLSTAHIFTLSLFNSMARGKTIVPIATPKHPAFLGCGSNPADRNLGCFFNVTNCVPGEDSLRFSQIVYATGDQLRSPWDLLLVDDEFFTPGGVTVVRPFKGPPWDTEHFVPSSSFSSYSEAQDYNKQALWYGMGRAGKVGVVRGSADGKTKQDLRQRRVHMVMVSLMSSWMLNRMHDNVMRVADEIMSRYTDMSGQPLWKSPVLAIHIRQTDKEVEDPYWNKHHGVYRPVEDYAIQMKQMEDEYGFRWRSVFIISDNGTTLESLGTLLSGNISETHRQNNSKPYIMYDWVEDDHLLEKFKNHLTVPSALKYDMQTHFLATLYIVQKIADHAIVTYSSNVGRFIGEIMAAKHRSTFVDCEGPLVTSLDAPWWWT